MTARSKLSRILATEVDDQVELALETEDGQRMLAVATPEQARRLGLELREMLGAEDQPEGPVDLPPAA